MEDRLRVLGGDSLEKLREVPDESVHCCVTSPPYWGLRDYGMDGQTGMEPTLDEFIGKMVAVFREVRRVLVPDGTCWINLGDVYAHSGACGGSSPVDNPTDGRTRAAPVRGRDTDKEAQRKTGGTLAEGLKPKDLCGVPWRVALALQADGWWLRQDIIWHKPNPIPESVTDRCTKSHEYIFLMTKSGHYWYDQKAIRMKSEEPVDWDTYRAFLGEDWNKGKSREDRMQTGMMQSRNKKAACAHPDGVNRRSVWSIPSQPYPEAHFATFPEDLPKLCILAGCPAGGTVLDPYAGSGTTGKVALELGRKALLIEKNPKYLLLIYDRCAVTPGFCF